MERRSVQFRCQSSVPVPFRDYISSMRFDYAQSPKSQWFMRVSQDSYLTDNALVAQATLPSTGLTTHNNYWNTVLSNTYTNNPTWVGTLVLDAQRTSASDADAQLRISASRWHFRSALPR